MKILQEQLRSIKKLLGLEKDDKSTLVQKYVSISVRDLRVQTAYFSCEGHRHCFREGWARKKASKDQQDCII